MQITSGDMPMLSDLQLVYMGPRNPTQLLKINTTKFQVEREPVYDMPMLSYLQLVYMGPRNSTQLLKINTTKFQVEREPVLVEWQHLLKTNNGFIRKIDL